MGDKEARAVWTHWPRRLLILPFEVVILAYRVTLSPIVGRQCRYMPTCSLYGLEAFREHGPVRGFGLTARRIGRCHPFAKGGYDPVPVPKEGKREDCAEKACECSLNSERP